MTRPPAEGPPAAGHAPTPQKTTHDAGVAGFLPTPDQVETWIAEAEAEQQALSSRLDSIVRD